MSVIKRGAAGRVLAFDYDGTLASEGKIGAEVVKALGEAKERGHRLVADDSVNAHPVAAIQAPQVVAARP